MTLEEAQQLQVGDSVLEIQTGDQFTVSGPPYQAKQASGIQKKVIIVPVRSQRGLPGYMTYNKIELTNLPVNATPTTQPDGSNSQS